MLVCDLETQLTEATTVQFRFSYVAELSRATVVESKRIVQHCRPCRWLVVHELISFRFVRKGPENVLIRQNHLVGMDLLTLKVRDSPWGIMGDPKGERRT